MLALGLSEAQRVHAGGIAPGTAMVDDTGGGDTFCGDEPVDNVLVSSGASATARPRSTRRAGTCGTR